MVGLTMLLGYVTAWSWSKVIDKSHVRRRHCFNFEAWSWVEVVLRHHHPHALFSRLYATNELRIHVASTQMLGSWTTKKERSIGEREVKLVDQVELNQNYEERSQIFAYFYYFSFYNYCNSSEKWRLSTQLTCKEA